METETLETLVAEEIRAQLGRKRRSNRWLAEQISRPTSSVNRWVNGTMPIKLNELDAMCRALDTTIADLLSQITWPRDGNISPSSPRLRLILGGAAAARASDLHVHGLLAQVS